MPPSESGPGDERLDLCVQVVRRAAAPGRRCRRGPAPTGAASEKSAASGSTKRRSTTSRTACGGIGCRRSCRSASAPSGPCRTWSHVSSRTLCTAALADCAASRRSCRPSYGAPNSGWKRVEAVEERADRRLLRRVRQRLELLDARRRDRPARAWPGAHADRGSRARRAAGRAPRRAAAPSAAAVVELDGLAERRGPACTDGVEPAASTLAQDRLEPRVEPGVRVRRTRCEHLVRALEDRRARRRRSTAACCTREITASSASKTACTGSASSTSSIVLADRVLRAASRTRPA